jgi:hypothetical protein
LREDEMSILGDVLEAMYGEIEKRHELGAQVPGAMLDRFIAMRNQRLAEKPEAGAMTATNLHPALPQVSVPTTPTGLAPLR